MLNSIIRSPALLLTIPLLVILSSNVANAEIYKWRDNRGVTQYSDRPPVSGFAKATRSEIVNALQTKDLCAVGPIKKLTSSAIASTRDFGAFFGGFVRRPVVAPKAVNAPITVASNNNVTAIGTTSPVNAQYSPLNPTSAFNSGGKTVLVFGSPAPPATSTPKPVTVAPATPTVAAPDKPSATAPVTLTPPAKTTTTSTTSLPTPTPAPTQVATVSNTPTTSTSNSSPNLVQVALMPAVDISKNIIPAVGYSNLRIQPSDITYPPSGGEFRIGCDVSHMSNDDPMVYPNQQGAAHHHTFFGNTSLNYKSNLMTLSSTGNSTCHGGIANRSAYWIPSVIDTSTNTPIVPDDTGFYYKAGAIDGSLIQAPPKGLRMIAGNSKASNEAEANAAYSCLPGPNSTRNDWPWSKSIPSGANCAAGDLLVLSVGFPQCWDGKNLDSPNHQDHMAHTSHRTDKLPNYYCPATHPIAIPQITVNIKFNITKQSQTANWRLASDNYSKSLPGGYSTHSDWVNGWDETVMAGIIKNCINAKRDAHSHLLCDGRTLY